MIIASTFNTPTMNIFNATASLLKQTSTRAFGVWPRTLLLAVALAPLGQAATETPPNRMTVQSYITDDTGTPLGSTTAVNKKMVFIVYTADTGGTVKFADEQIVTVDAGHFSVVLGEGSPVGEENHDLSIAFSGADASDRFIEIQVSDTDGSNAQTLSPRLRLLPSAYAFLAAYANEAARVTGGGVDTAALSDSAVNSAKIANESLTVDDLGPNSVGSSEVIDNSLTAADLGVDSVGNSELAPELTFSGHVGVNQRWPNVTMGLKSVNSSDYLIYGLNSAGQNDFYINSAGTLYTRGGLSANLVNSVAVLDNSLTASDLAADSVGASEIAANAVGASEIGANQVGTSEIAPAIQFTDGIGVNHYAYSDVALSLQAQSGDNWLIYALNSGGSKVFSVDKNGFTVTPFGTVTLSDRRLKTDIRPLGNVLEKVIQLEPSSYYLREFPDAPEQIGFVAQDVREVFPEAVTDGGGDYLGLSYQSFGVLAIGAIKELNAKVENLEAENTALSERLAALEALVHSIAR